MRLTTIVAATGAIFTASVKGLACKDGVKYCAYNLQSGGHCMFLLPIYTPSVIKLSLANYSTLVWTEDEIWSQLQSEGLPDGYTKNHIKHTLFKCQDHWYWSKAHLYYVEWCANSCQNGGDGNDDRCRPHTDD
jgi:hypothetical protein